MREAEKKYTEQDFKEFKWKIRQAKDVIAEAVTDIQLYQKGLKRPLKTRYSHLNHNLLGGLFPGQILVLAGASSSGKSYVAQMIEEDFLNIQMNPGADKVCIVRCNWEMSAKDLLLRRLGRTMKMDTDEILFPQSFSPKEKEQFDSVVNWESDKRIFYFEDAVTPEVWYEQMVMLLEMNSRKGIHTVIEIDHIALTLSAGNKKDAVDKIIEYANKLKKTIRYNCSFIIISQLNREIEKRDAHKDMAPQRGDLYQSDTMFHIGEVVLVIHRPEFLYHDEYMQFKKGRYDHLDRFKTDSGTRFKTEGLVFYHYLKLRTERKREKIRRVFVETLPGYEDMYPEKPTIVTTNEPVKDLTKDFSEEKKPEEEKKELPESPKQLELPIPEGIPEDEPEDLNPLNLDDCPF